MVSYLFIWDGDVCFDELGVVIFFCEIVDDGGVEYGGVIGNFDFEVFWVVKVFVYGVVECMKVDVFDSLVFV